MINSMTLHQRISTLNKNLLAFLIPLIERYLTHQAKRKYILVTKAKRRGLLLDWFLALIWAVGWVFLINQYLVQAYQIPSESMEKTLLVGDRIFVNKLLYGPEVLPNFIKLPSPIKAKRGDIIIFQSPEYISKGPIFEVVHRLLYMISFSSINLNKNEIDLLIKRAVGYAGDQIIIRNGDAFIKARGESDFISEKEFFKRSNIPFNVQRILPESEYKSSEILMINDVYNREGVALPFPYNSSANQKIIEEMNSFTNPQMFLNEEQIRYNSQSYTKAKILYQLYPYLKKYRQDFYALEKGIYVKDGYVLPMGDNRDNSHDGRAWGVVPMKKVLGSDSMRFWPLNRLGEI